MKIHLGVTLISLMVVLLMAVEGKPQRSDDCPKDCTCESLFKICDSDRWLTLSCSSRSTPLGRVRADTFKSHGNAFSLTIQDCDLTKTSFDFLSQFPKLVKLNIKSSSIKELVDMPFFQNLNEISFIGSTHLEKWYNSAQTPKIDRLNFNEMPDLDDRKMDSILSSMTQTLIYPELGILEMSKNSLTRVPPLVSVFPALSMLDLDSNPITTLKTGSVQKGSTDLKVIDLSGTGLTTIEPGAFVGDFSSTEIKLHQNSIKSFSSTVFKDLLKSMAHSTFGGYVIIGENPIAFDCNLKWLLVDNRDLLPKILGAKISNGTWFEDLNQQELMNC